MAQSQAAQGQSDRSVVSSEGSPGAIDEYRRLNATGFSWSLKVLLADLRSNAANRRRTATPGAPPTPPASTRVQRLGACLRGHQRRWIFSAYADLAHRFLQNILEPV
jgi:hypothetical protein